MIRRPPRSNRTDTLFPYTTLFRSRAHRAHLFVERFARRRDLEAPFGLAARQHHVAFQHPQFLVGELAAVVDVDLAVVVPVGDVEPPFPQRARWIGFLPLPADLPVTAAIGFAAPLRSEERRVGKECVCTCRTR